jgi:hypothetical protein
MDLIVQANCATRSNRSERRSWNILGALPATRPGSGDQPRLDGADRRGARIRRTRLSAANAQPRGFQMVPGGRAETRLSNDADDYRSLQRAHRGLYAVITETLVRAAWRGKAISLKVRQNPSQGPLHRALDDPTEDDDAGEADRPTSLVLSAIIPAPRRPGAASPPYRHGDRAFAPARRSRHGSQHASGRGSCGLLPRGASDLETALLPRLAALSDGCG